MLHCTRRIVLTLFAVVLVSSFCQAQDVEPPFTWIGKGTASIISEDGTTNIEFDFELSVDENGMVEGKTTNDEGSSSIKHVFCTEKKEYGFPGFFSRKIAMVLMINEYSDNPMLSILNGRILNDKYLYGELLIAQYEEGSDTANMLGVNNAEVTLIYGDELSDDVQSVINQCLPLGIVKIEGDYKSDEIEEIKTISLFSDKELKDGYIYSEKAGTDPKKVWKVQDGALICSGKPTGFLRTKNEYSEFKLTFDWRWPEKPGNSGVLLYMSSEDKVWPLCMEAQLMHARAGDIVGMGCDFNENKTEQGSFIRYTPRLHDSNEAKPGDWNSYEIVCKDNTMELTINGRLQNKATGISLRKGYIGFQSEGVPIVFRNITLTPLR